MFSRLQQNVTGENVGDGSSVLACARAFVVGRSFSYVGAVMQRGLCFQPLVHPLGSRWLRLADAELDVEAKPLSSCTASQRGVLSEAGLPKSRIRECRGTAFLEQVFLEC